MLIAVIAFAIWLAINVEVTRRLLRHKDPHE